MRNILDFTKRSRAYPLFASIYYLYWVIKGKPVPPPNITKEKQIQKYAALFDLRTLIETGTYRGDMIFSLKSHFEKIISIELDQTLYLKAQQRFSQFEHITLYNGDSAELLPSILQDISSSCIFWLDAHYSGGETAMGSKVTPIINELNTIMDHKYASAHVILIDDARLFNGNNGYPPLIKFKEFVLKNQPSWNMTVRDDIIRLHN